MLLSSIFYIYLFVLVFMLFRSIVFDLHASVSSFYLHHFLFTSISLSSFFNLLLVSSFSSAVPIIPCRLLQELTTIFSLWVYMLYLFLPAVSRPIFRICIIPRFLFVYSFSFVFSWFPFPFLLLLISFLFSTYLSIIFFRFLFLLITPTFIFYLFVPIPDFCLLRFVFSLQLSLLSLFASLLISLSLLLYLPVISLFLLTIPAFLISPLLPFPYFFFHFFFFLTTHIFVCPSLSLISLWFVFFTKPASTFAIFHFNGIFHSNYFYPRNFLFTCPFLCLYSFFYRLPLIPFFPAAPSSTIYFHLLVFSICL